MRCTYVHYLASIVCVVYRNGKTDVYNACIHIVMYDALLFILCNKIYTQVLSHIMREGERGNEKEKELNRNRA